MSIRKAKGRLLTTRLLNQQTRSIRETGKKLLELASAAIRSHCLTMAEWSMVEKGIRLLIEAHGEISKAIDSAQDRLEEELNRG